MGCWIQDEQSVLGLMLMWPFPTPDRARLAQFRAEVDALSLAETWRKSLHRDRPSATHTAVVDIATGGILGGVDSPDHPMQVPAVYDASQRAAGVLQPHQTTLRYTVAGWHFRLRRLDADAAAVRIAPLDRVPLPTTHVLTPQQRRVASLATRGHTVNDMAAALGVAPQTVRTHLKRVYQQLQANNRVELANQLRRSPFHKVVSP